LRILGMVYIILIAIPLGAQQYQGELEVYGRDRDGPSYQVGADLRFSFDPLQRDDGHLTDASQRFESRSWLHYHFDHGSEEFSVISDDIVRSVHRLEGVVEVCPAFSVGGSWQFDTLRYTRWTGIQQSVENSVIGVVL